MGKGDVRVRPGKVDQHPVGSDQVFPIGEKQWRWIVFPNEEGSWLVRGDGGGSN